MSASLVGSEMCIRDSIYSPQFDCASCSPRAGQCAAHPGRPSFWAKRRRCLLYTSDAADDM
eukprot:6838725-Alexandrium_andersonii.AAC.1